MSTWITKRAKELGIPKVDAKASLFLEVIPSDIVKGVQKNPTCCAFANATKRGIPGVHRVYFFRSCAWIEYDDRMLRYTLPLSCRTQIKAFDKTKKMTPGVYRLDSPKGAHTLDTQRHSSKKRFKKGRKRGTPKTKRQVVAQDRIVTPGGTAPEEKPVVRSTNPAKWPQK